MGVLTYKGATVAELAAGEAPRLVAGWTKSNNLRRRRGAGGRHDLRRGGLPQLPHLCRIRRVEPRRPRSDRDRQDDNDAAFFAQYVANPRKFGNQVMPIFGEKYGGSLSDKQLQQVAAFLAASKGGG